MKTIQKIITEHGGLDAVRENYISIENPPWLRLVIEVISPPSACTAYTVSVAHYGTQNGDAMRDPEVTFRVVPVPALFGKRDHVRESLGQSDWIWEPLTYLNDYVPSIAAGRPDKAFCRMWDRNIAAQGFLQAFRAKKKRLGTKCPERSQQEAGKSHQAHV